MRVTLPISLRVLGNVSTEESGRGTARERDGGRTCRQVWRRGGGGAGAVIT